MSWLKSPKTDFLSPHDRDNIDEPDYASNLSLLHVLCNNAGALFRDKNGQHLNQPKKAPLYFSAKLMPLTSAKCSVKNRNFLKNA